MEECKDSIDDGQQECEPHSDTDHKDMVDDKLCVSVDEAQEGVQLDEGACTLVLTETLLKVQLQVWYMQRIYSYV